MPAERPGPTQTEFTALVARRTGETPVIRALHCTFFAEEGTEWTCRYEERASTGVWVQLAADIAIDGNGYLFTDTVCTADQALADRGSCPRNLD